MDNRASRSRVIRRTTFLARHPTSRSHDEMAPKKVLVRGADGAERELVLLRIAGQPAYVCPASRYSEAVDNPDAAVGFPIRDVKMIEAAN